MNYYPTDCLNVSKEELFQLFCQCQVKPVPDKFLTYILLKRHMSVMHKVGVCKRCSPPRTFSYYCTLCWCSWHVNEVN